MAKTDFPKSFLFGTATASYQIEGAVHEDGRGESIWDRFSHTPGKTHQGETGDVACDSYHLFEEDIRLMKAMGCNAYRFSIAWPRIIPEGEGQINPKGLDYYARVADRLGEAGVTPFATMYHWDLPQGLEDKYGGWRSRKTVEAFARYAETIVRKLGGRIKNWMTLNEIPCTVYLGHKSGVHAPGAHESDKVLNQIRHHCLLAHGHGVAAVRQHGRRGSRVGLVHNPGCKVPAIETSENIEAARRAFTKDNGQMLEPLARGTYPAAWLKQAGAEAPQIECGDLELIRGRADFIGLNVYGGSFVEAADNADSFRPIEFPPNYPHAFAEWIKIVPQSVYWTVKFLHEDHGYDVIYVSENGCCMDDQLKEGEVLDTDRTQYMREYLAAAARAVAEGLPLRGYFAWTLMDNFEWATGTSNRFGLHYTDFGTQRRIPKLSAKYYAACIKSRQVL